MRDPAGKLEFHDKTVIRVLHRRSAADDWLHSQLAREWCSRGDMVAFELIDDLTIHAPRLPFVSQPSEWCDAQLFDAAKLTLALQEEAVASGFDMKDASAWNVIFDGCRPVFCDLLSFEKLTLKQWWAAGQFSRHFLLPLLLSRRRGFCGYESFLCWRDGVPEVSARAMLGPSRFLTRYWPLMARGSGIPEDATSRDQQPPAPAGAVLAFRKSLNGSLRWMLSGVDPASAPRRRTVWRDYVERRPHYTDADLQAKRQTIEQWLRSTMPSWVLDLGCNSGEFSRIALDTGASVVAVDLDHGAIERLYRAELPRLYPLLVRLDDLQGGRGWAGREHPGLSQRLHQHTDLVMILALIHHLAIGAAVPLSAIAGFAASCSRRWCVVEVLAPDDPQVRSLCDQRRRSTEDFSIDHQLQAFGSVGFTVRARVRLPSGYRELVLLEKSE